MWRASSIVVAGLALLLASAGQAIPSLQLGPGSDGSDEWSYENRTWVTNDHQLSLLATANSENGNGDYAWDQSGTTQTAYLVVYSQPKGTSDPFNILLENDGGVTLVASGFGIAPENDPNTPSHGVADNNTYYQVYEFQFDGPEVTIENTDPTKSDTGLGYTETFDITIVSLGGEDATGLHFDLFTVAGNGIWDPTASNDKDLVSAFAPWTHDAEYQMPEPNAALLFGIGTLVVSARARRRC